MDTLQVTSALRLLQSADEIRARLSGEFSSIHGLSVNEFFLMSHLERAERHRLPRVELAKRMYLSASTVTRMAATMEKIGLLSREAHPRDARSTFVVLTPTGQTKLGEARATLAKHAGYVFGDRWTDEELQTLSTLLHRLVAGTTANLT